MKQTIDHKYAFTIQLNMNCYNDGSLYYGGYQAECSSSLINGILKVSAWLPIMPQKIINSNPKAIFI